MGLATARAFAEAGAAVALADVNEAAVRAAAEGLFAGGRKATSFRCNVADEADVSAVVKQTVARFGRWMQHSTMPACNLQSARPPTTSGEDFDRVNAINLRGVSSGRIVLPRNDRLQGQIVGYVARGRGRRLGLIQATPSRDLLSALSIERSD